MAYIIATLLGKDKYLQLAHYLLKNRSDWSDGSSIAQTALNDFDTETEQDQEILESIQSEINNFEDGRQFRDCKWSYNEIFALVDEEILKDYNLIVESIYQTGKDY